MDFEAVAAQLRHPKGEFGLKVAIKMNESNSFMNLSTIEKLNIQPYDHVMEIGMGNGFFVKNILESNKTIKYTGCDYSSSMVLEATNLNQTFFENGRCEFLECNSDALPFPDNFFDKILAVNTLYFCENPIKDIVEIMRVLKKDGTFSIAIRPKYIMENLPFTSYNFTLYNSVDLENLFKNAEVTNFSIDEIVEPDQEVNGQMMSMRILLAAIVK